MEDNKEKEVLEAQKPSSEEQVKGLEEQKKVDADDKDYKTLYEKVLSDKEKESKYAQDLKAKLKAKMTEEELAKAELEEREKHYKQIEKENKIIKFKSQLSKSISDSDTLDAVADSLVNGDIASAMEKINQQFLSQKENYEKQLEQEKLLKNPEVPAGKSKLDEKPITEEQFYKLDYSKLVELKKSNPDLYKKLTANDN